MDVEAITSWSQNPEFRNTKISFWVTATTTLITIGWAVMFAVVAIADETTYSWMLEKDNTGGAGLAENLTVLVLLPAILAAGFTLIRWQRRLPSRSLAAWLLCWTLACIYFAGEEMSWGQWYFGWETPDSLAELNDQGEANLHNISSWLDQKPRTAVEAFILLAGLLIPVVLHLKPTLPCRQWVRDLLAPAMCWAAAGYWLVLRFAGALPGVFFDRHTDSELRELAIAWFLALYLISYALRAAGADQALRSSSTLSTES